ncbi:ankyrin, partial [Wilcoxina mikolae CBS 423.85]
LTEVLLRGGADRNAKDCNGMTPLFYAVVNWKKKPEILVSLLLQWGADVNVTCEFDTTALHHAAHLNSEAISGELVHHGASLHSKDCYGNTPLFEAVLARGETIVSLFIQQGADVRSKNNYERTVLHEA